MFSILQETLLLTVDGVVVKEVSSIGAVIKWVVDTGPLLVLLPIMGPVCTFFGHDCIGHGQLELWYCGVSEI